MGHPGRRKNHRNSKKYNERRIQAYLGEFSPANRDFACQFDFLKVSQGVRSSSREHVAQWKNRITKIGAWQAVNRIQRATGMRRFRLHDFRHTAITRAVEAGVELVEVSMRFWGIPHS